MRSFSKQHVTRLSTLVFLALISSLIKGIFFDRKIVSLRNQSSTAYQEMISLERLSKAVALAEFSEVAAVLAKGQDGGKSLLDYASAKESALKEAANLSRSLDTVELNKALNLKFLELDRTIQLKKVKGDGTPLEILTSNNRFLSTKQVANNIARLEFRLLNRRRVLNQKLSRTLSIRDVFWVAVLVFSSLSIAYAAFCLIVTRRERLKALIALQEKTAEQEEELRVLQEDSRRMQGEIIARLQSTEDKEAIKNVILSTFLHDSRIYICIVKSSVEILEKYGNQWVEERKEKHYGKILRAADSLLSLMENSLLLLKDTDAKVNRETLNLKLFCEEEIEKWCLLCRGTGRAFRFEEAGIERPVTTNRMLLTRILDNLISNAIKYSDGQIVIQLNFSHPDLVVLSVADSGRGIKQTELSDIFDTCIRGSNSGNISGFGIGLASVKRAAHLLDLGLDVWSEEGRGSEFRIVFRE